MGDLIHISDLTQRVIADADANLEKAMSDLREAQEHLDALNTKLTRHIEKLEDTLSRDSDTDNGGGAA